MKIPKFKTEIGRVHQGIGIATFALFYGVLAYFGKEQIYWEGTQNLFRYSADFFRTAWTSLETSPIATFYVNRFLLQFFIFPGLGALIIVGLYGLLYAILRKLQVNAGFSPIFSHYTALAFLTGFTIWMFLPIFSFFLLLPMIVFYGTIHLFSRIANVRKRRYFACIMLWILPFFIGVWTFGIGLFAILYECKKKTFKSTLIFALLVLISILAPPYLWQYLLFTQNYLSILTTVPYYLSIAEKSWFWPVIALPFALLIGATLIPKGRRLFKNVVGYGIFGVVFVSTAFWGFYNIDFQLFRLYFRTAYQVEHKDWESALSTCQRYLELVEQEPDEDKGVYYAWIVDDVKFALCQTGRLLDDFFSYSKHLAFGILFPQALERADKSHPGVYNFNSSMGLHSEAIHSAFECVITGIGGPLVLENLIQSHLILGDYRPCVEFVNMLDESLFFRKQAKNYRKILQDTAILNTDSCYIRKRKLQPTHDFGTSWNIDKNMYGLFLANTNHQKAFEYAITTMLTYKEHHLIANHLERFKEFNYTHFPRHVEEALLILLNYGTDPEMTKEKILGTEFAGLKIREETINRCDEFFTYLDKYNAGQISSKTIREHFGDTYWHHFLFITLKPIELQGQTTYDI